MTVNLGYLLMHINEVSFMYSFPPGGGNGNPLQYFCLENSMVRGAWRATVHGVAKSRTRLSDYFYFLYVLCLQHSELAEEIELWTSDFMIKLY